MAPKLLHTPYSQFSDKLLNLKLPNICCYQATFEGDLPHQFTRLCSKAGAPQVHTLQPHAKDSSNTSDTCPNMQIHMILHALLLKSDGPICSKIGREKKTEVDPETIVRSSAKPGRCIEGCQWRGCLLAQQGDSQMVLRSGSKFKIRKTQRKRMGCQGSLQPFLQTEPLRQMLAAIQVPCSK